MFLENNFTAFLCSYISHSATDTTNRFSKVKIDFYLDKEKLFNTQKFEYSEEKLKSLKQGYNNCGFLKEVALYSIANFKESDVLVYNSHLETLNEVAKQNLEVNFFRLITSLCNKENNSLESDNLKLLYTMLLASSEIGSGTDSKEELKKMRNDINNIYKLKFVEDIPIDSDTQIILKESGRIMIVR